MSNITIIPWVEKRESIGKKENREPRIGELKPGINCVSKTMDSKSGQYYLRIMASRGKYPTCAPYSNNFGLNRKRS
jgi:hypothetical protein